MNRYPLWTYIVIAITLVLGAVYTVPNFFGETEAVQIAPIKLVAEVDSALLGRVEEALKAAQVKYRAVEMDQQSIKIRFSDADEQLKAKDALERALNPDPKSPSYGVALNLLSDTPRALTMIRALPMYLGLDLRGGVHMLLQVDMKGASEKRLDSAKSDIRSRLRSKDLAAAGIARDRDNIVLYYDDAARLDKARELIKESYPDFDVVAAEREGRKALVASLKPTAIKEIQSNAIKQNITTLNNRVNELGVAEPVIQQQGQDRIVVQMPGVQDPTRVRDIIGRTASLELRLVDETADVKAAIEGQLPFNTELYYERDESAVVVKKDVVLTGDRFINAQSNFDQQTSQPIVNVSVDPQGGRVLRDVTRENLRKRMAILLFEKGKGELLTAPTIQDEFGENFRITGQRSAKEAADLALLIRSGSLAAPMTIIEERTVGPSLGKENIQRGFNSTVGGFIAIAVFMILYYVGFGAISVVALGCNLLFLIGLLSLLQATLTLPGMAAIALTIGMAIDANVLINERIREELRNGETPQAAIHKGYDRAFGTILDSNVTTFIAGLALLIFGSGPVRGFAVVLCLGILTSMFSAVTVSRAMVNLTYGRRARLAGLSI